jgi:hypothetical protein
MELDQKDEYTKWLEIKDEPFSADSNFPLSDSDAAIPDYYNPSFPSSPSTTIMPNFKHETAATLNSTSNEKRAKKRTRKDNVDEMDVFSSSGNVLKSPKVIFGDEKLLDVFTNFKANTNLELLSFFETLRTFLTKLNEAIPFLFANYTSSQGVISVFLQQANSLISAWYVYLFRRSLSQFKSFFS